MIDIATEDVISISEAARRLPSLKGGRPVNPSTVYRWIATGVGGVRLESIKVGGGRCTSVEALQRFVERLSGSDRATAPARSTSRQRRAQVDRAARNVAARLGT